MTLNLSIDIPQEAVQALESCAASQGEDLSTHAGHVLVKYATTMRQRPTAPANSNLLSSLDEAPLPANIEARTKLARALLEQYRSRQKVVPLPDDPPGISDRWPPGESIEDFLQTIRDVNEASEPRVLP